VSTMVCSGVTGVSGEYHGLLSTRKKKNATRESERVWRVGHIIHVDDVAARTCQHRTDSCASLAKLPPPALPQRIPSASCGGLADKVGVDYTTDEHLHLEITCRSPERLPEGANLAIISRKIK
jgi:hypothetical protein